MLQDRQDGKVLQIETLDTYLKLLLQVLELRYIASLLFATIKLLFTSDACKSQEWQRKPFFFFVFAVSKQIDAKEVNRSYFVNPNIQSDGFKGPL